MLTRRKFLGLTMKGVFLIGAGNSLQSFSGSGFTLPDRKAVRLRFAVASDGHYGQDGTDFRAMHGKVVDWLNAEKEGRGVDFTVINGDLFHNEDKWMPEVKKQFDRLDMPYYVSRGNHDISDASNWVKCWNIPLHHHFEKHGAAFLILDTVDDKGNYLCPDLQWTSEQLHRYRSHKELFVFMHITPLNWTSGGNPCPELVELFDGQANLKAVFHGHDHDQDGVKDHNGKRYFFDSHIGGNWGTEYHGYRIVEIMKNGEILTYQMDGLKGEKVNDHTI